MFHRLFEMENEGQLKYIRVRVFDTEVSLYFKFQEDANEKVKSIEGSVFQSHDKSWSVPLTEASANDVEDLIHELEEIFIKDAEQADLDQKRRFDIAEQVHLEMIRDFDHSALHWDYQEEFVSLACPYSVKAVKAIKKIPGRQWNGDEKIWLFPADQERAIRKAMRVIIKEIK